MRRVHAGASCARGAFSEHVARPGYAYASLLRARSTVESYSMGAGFSLQHPSVVDSVDKLTITTFQ
jgi:hypothetical protein